MVFQVRMSSPDEQSLAVWTKRIFVPSALTHMVIVSGSAFESATADATPPAIVADTTPTTRPESRRD